MKKKIMLLCVCMVLLSACGAQAEQAVPDDTKTSSVSTSAESITETTTTEQTAKNVTEMEKPSETEEITTTADIDISNLVLKSNNSGEKQYSWHVEPTIVAKQIDNIERSRTYWGDPLYDTTWHSRFFLIRNSDDESAVIDIDNIC